MDWERKLANCLSTRSPLQNVWGCWSIPKPGSQAFLSHVQQVDGNGQVRAYGTGGSHRWGQSRCFGLQGPKTPLKLGERQEVPIGEAMNRGAGGPQLGDAKALILLLQMDMTTTPTQWRLKVMAVCEKEPQGLVSSW
jgi:hypothetical protein